MAAPRYRSISAIGNRVTFVTRRSSGASGWRRVALAEERAFDPRGILAALEQARVSYVLIGSPLVAAASGFPAAPGNRRNSMAAENSPP